MDRRKITTDTLEFEDDGEDEEEMNGNNKKVFRTPCSFNSGTVADRDDTFDGLAGLSDEDDLLLEDEEEEERNNKNNKKSTTSSAKTPITQVQKSPQEIQQRKILNNKLNGMIGAVDPVFSKIIKKYARIEAPIVISDIQTFKDYIYTQLIDRGSENNQKFKLDHFREGLEQFLKNPEALHISLAPVTSDSTLDNHYHDNSYNFDSLIRILLSIPLVQPYVFQALFDTVLVNYITEDNNNIIKQTFSQFRWLDSISNTEFTGRASMFLDLLSSNIELKKDIIRFIPDIIDDICHKTFVDILMDTLDKEQDLISSVLDALTNLNMNSQILTKVRKQIGEQLKTSEFQDLPIRISFLLSTTTASKEMSIETVRLIRSGLEIDKPRLDNGSTTEILKYMKNNNNNNNGSNKASEQLIIEAFKSGIRFKKELCVAFQDEIRADKQSKIADIWIIILMHSFNYTKETEKLLKDKVKSGVITSRLLLESIFTHEHALRQNFTTMLSLCDFLIRCSELKVRLFGVSFYINLFKCYRDEYMQRELIQMIIAHIASNNQNEVNCGLDVLISLCSEYCSGMLIRFSHEIKRILDQIDYLTEAQIRTLFKVFGTLLYTEELSDNGYKLEKNIRIYSELDIFTRKQITSPKIKFKKIGIISICSQISRISKRIIMPSTNNNGKSVNSIRGGSNNSQAIVETAKVFDLPVELKEEFLKLFENLKVNCDKSRLALAYLYDELANVHSSEPIHEEVIDLLSEFSLKYFQQEFISYSIGTSSSDDDNTIWGIIKDESGDAIVIYPNLKDSPTTKDNNKLLCLSPSFRLIQKLQPKDELLEGIDAMLGHRFVMFSTDKFHEDYNLSNDKDKDIYNLSLYYAINYIRELLNAFSILLKPSPSNSKSTPLVVSSFYDRLLDRLETLIEMEDRFEIVLSHCPSFTIPYGTFDSVDQRKSFSIDLRKTKKSVAASKQQQETSDKEPNKKEIKEANKSNIDHVDYEGPSESLVEVEKTFIKLIKPYFRPLDLSCFLILVNSNNRVGGRSNNNSGISNQLSEISLLYLLEEFYSKLSLLAQADKTNSLTANQVKVTLPYSYSEFIRQIGLTVFPSLCGHLEKCAQSLKIIRKQLIEVIIANEKLIKQKSKLQKEHEDATDKNVIKQLKSLKNLILTNATTINNLNEKQARIQHCVQIILKSFEKLFQTGDLIFSNDGSNSLFSTLLNLIKVEASKRYGVDNNNNNQQQQLQSQSNSSTGIVKTAALSLFHYFKSFVDVFVGYRCFKASFSLLEVLESLYNTKFIGIYDSEDLKHHLHQYSAILLSVSWSESNKNKVQSTSLAAILKSYFDTVKENEHHKEINTAIQYLLKYFVDSSNQQASKKNLLTTSSGSSKKSKGKQQNDDDPGEDEEMKNGEEENEEMKDGGNEEDDNKYIEMVDNETSIPFVVSSLNVYSVQAYLRSVYLALIENLKKENIKDDSRQQRTPIDEVRHVKNASMYIRNYGALVNTAKERDKSTYLQETMKQSVVFISTLLKNYIPVFRGIFKTKNVQLTVKVVESLEALKNHSRVLHDIVEHGKQKDDQTIIDIGPTVKRVLEQVNCEVKDALVAIDAQRAYGTTKIDRKKLNGDDYISDEENDSDPSYSDEENPKKKRDKKSTKKSGRKKKKKKVDSDEEMEEEEEEQPEESNDEEVDKYDEDEEEQRQREKKERKEERRRKKLLKSKSKSTKRLKKSENASDDDEVDDLVTSTVGSDISDDEIINITTNRKRGRSRSRSKHTKITS